jgi:hypothetical protein
MTATPTRLAAELAAAAEKDFGALQKRRSEIDARLGKMTPADQETFKSELTRLLRRSEITKSKPGFRRSWSGAKD